MSLVIAPGLVVPNPYNPLEDWTIVAVDDKRGYVTIRWADGGETIGDIDGPALASAIRHATVFAPGNALRRAEVASLTVLGTRAAALADPDEVDEDPERFRDCIADMDAHAAQTGSPNGIVDEIASDLVSEMSDCVDDSQGYHTF